jgi:hypothetical protein
MRASSISFPAAVLMAITGMLWGIHMAMSNDHSTMPAHAHLNLLGWVSLFLMGVFYRLHPPLDGSFLARLQVVIWIVSSIVLTAGVGLIYSGQKIGDAIAAVSSLVVLADMLLFGWLVLRAPGKEQAV